MGQGNGEPGCAVMLLGQLSNFQYLCGMASGSITGWQEVERGPWPEALDRRLSKV